MLIQVPTFIADHSQFKISSQSGVLEFKNQPELR